MSTSNEKNDPLKWIFINIIMGTIVFIVNFRLLKIEFGRIASGSDMYITKHLRWTAFISILCGVLFAFFIVVQPIPGFCYISIQLQTSFLVNQLVFLGFYQLCRLYYCFAKSQVHSDKGYPNYLFIIMGTIGVILMINAIIFPWFYFPFISECGIKQSNYIFYMQYSSLIDSSTSENWFVISFCIVSIMGFHIVGVIFIENKIISKISRRKQRYLSTYIKHNV